MSESWEHLLAMGRGAARVNRRVVLKGAGAAVAGALAGLPGRTLAAAGTSAASPVPGKDARLVVHAAEPAVFETPIKLLAENRVTPAELLFVRNNQQPADAATMKPTPLAGWKIELAGQVDRPMTLDAHSLTAMAQEEVEMVLQCSGNSRSLFAASAMTKGTQWGRGGMGNVRFGGVRLATVLDHCRLKIKPQARYLTAEGTDAPKPGEQDFEHSIPLDEALKKSLLAIRLNGQPLAAIHGGPVRLVTPGYYGTMHVKWLSRLRFEGHESDHTSQIPNYRTPREPIKPGTPYAYTFENSEPNWRMKIKCVVLSPAAGSKLSTDDVRVAGVAFNDGHSAIDTVLVSPDAGRTWQRAELETPDSPYAWYRWQAVVKLPAGKQQIWAMAVDKLGRSQPADGAIHWNPQGYTWNGVEKIDVQVSAG